MSELIVREALGERRFVAADLPLAFGGAGSGVVLAGSPAGPTVHLGWHEDQLYVQPMPDAAVLHNGVSVHKSTWLKNGDVIDVGLARLRVRSAEGLPVIEVEDGSAGNLTAPPVITQHPHAGGVADADAEPIAAVRFRTTAAAAPARPLIKPARLVLAGVGVVVGAVLWFIFTAVSIGITTNPVGAKIDIDGVLPGFAVGGRYLLRPGDYRVRATHQGYAPAQRRIAVATEPNQRFTFQLAKLPGILRIGVPAPAQVTIDGRATGVAPGDFRLNPGKHRIELTTERYQMHHGSVAVAGAQQIQSYAPKLIPAWGNVTVTSEPAAAQLRVDGVERGVTPLTIEIMSGNRPIELRLAGFKPWTTDVQVQPNAALSIGPVKLGLPDGQLVLRTDPPGASVSVSGVYRGQTPLAIELRPEMAHTMVVTKPGYAALTREVRLGADERRTQSFALTGVFGEVSIRAQPADAQLYVDDQARGAPNQMLRLVATTHDIEIRKPGFVAFKTRVTPRPGLAQVIETTLLTAEQTRIAATPAVIRTQTEQPLKLMPIGRFTMGSPLRSAGRRANEGQREVEFRRAFYAGVNEVTNAEFRRFRAEHRSGMVGSSTLDLDNQPAVSVSWQDAAAYCNWLSEQEGLPPAYRKDGDEWVPVTPLTRGYRLLTDAEWEWVARYVSAGRLRRYPWGDALPVAPASGNYADKTANILIQDLIPEYDDGFATTAPVGKFSPNALGLYDLGGNVAEWTHDYYAVSIDAAQPATDPTGPPQGKQHVIRGSSWKQSSVTDLRLAARDFGGTARNDVGLRIARYVE